MTTEELRAVKPGTPLFLPDGWYVTEWIAGGMVPDTDYYTLRHPPDRQNPTNTRRPILIHALELLPATLSDKEAWAYNVTELHARINHIMNVELKKP